MSEEQKYQHQIPDPRVASQSSQSSALYAIAERLEVLIAILEAKHDEPHWYLDKQDI